jgi:hypothetical protein
MRSRERERVREGGKETGGGRDSRFTEWCCCEQKFYKDLDLTGNVPTQHYKHADV